jgi:hypothetical protein
MDEKYGDLKRLTFLFEESRLKTPQLCLQTCGNKLYGGYTWVGIFRTAGPVAHSRYHSTFACVIQVTKINHDNYSREYQKSRSLYRHSNSTSLEYDPGVPITEQQCSIHSTNKDRNANLFLFVVNRHILRNEEYVESNERVVSEWWIGKDLEGRGRDIILRCYPDFRLEGLKTTTIKPQSGSSVFGPIFQPETSRIRSRSVNHSTMTFEQYI